MEVFKYLWVWFDRGNVERRYEKAEKLEGGGGGQELVV